LGRSVGSEPLEDGAERFVNLLSERWLVELAPSPPSAPVHLHLPFRP
jgi:hypothetical protein